MPPWRPGSSPAGAGGSAIIRDAWWSSIVIGACICARGFIAAQARCATATAPNCSLVVPYFCMCRRAARAYIALVEVSPDAAAIPPNPVKVRRPAP